MNAGLHLTPRMSIHPSLGPAAFACWDPLSIQHRAQQTSKFVHSERPEGSVHELADVTTGAESLEC